MGNSVFSVHCRDKKTHTYNESKKINMSENTALATALGVFKREVYMYALEREWVDCKSLYLYNGWTRLAKAEQTQPNLLTVTFREADDCAKFLEVEEKLTGQRWPIAGEAFMQKWEVTPHELGQNVVCFLKTG